MECIWNAYGMHKECIRKHKESYGMHRGCIGIVLDIYLAAKRLPVHEFLIF